MKVRFTAKETHTQEYKEYVEWMAAVWKANDKRNKRIEAQKFRMQLMDDINCIDEGDYVE